MDPLSPDQALHAAFARGALDRYFDILRDAPRIGNVVQATRACLRSDDPAGNFRLIVDRLEPAQTDDPEFETLLMLHWDRAPDWLRASEDKICRILDNPRTKRCLAINARRFHPGESPFGRDVARRLPALRDRLSPAGLLSAALFCPEPMAQWIAPLADALLTTDFNDFTEFLGLIALPGQDALQALLFDHLAEFPGRLDGSGDKGLHLLIGFWSFGITLPDAAQAGLRRDAQASPALQDSPFWQNRFAPALRLLDRHVACPPLPAGTAPPRIFVAVIGQLRGHAQTLAGFHAFLGQLPDPIVIVDSWTSTGTKLPTTIDTVERAFRGALADRLRRHLASAALTADTFATRLPNLCRFIQSQGRADAAAVQAAYGAASIVLEDDTPDDIASLPNPAKQLRRFQSALRQIRGFDPRPDDLVVRVRPDMTLDAESVPELPLGEMIDRVQRSGCLFTGKASDTAARCVTWAKGPAVDDNFALGRYHEMQSYLGVLDWAEGDDDAQTLATPAEAHATLGWRLFTQGIRLENAGYRGHFVSEVFGGSEGLIAALRLDLAQAADSPQGAALIADLIAAAEGDLHAAPPA
ncbi:hypothetical protein [Tropicibacter oceani]|uniref:Uncharacterized protein n=1 Tax=Tropicibacter oceani TaxID=3058420 RepID=A0ABY8QF19_9RHOB|nr:hypothetical protein [Tropicibacter oceani]WGW03215.1 hypothetical protein QF118_14970 [Tropicibacter oceani]